MQYDPTLAMPFELGKKALQYDVIEKNDFATLWTIPSGYVVTGGSRGPGVGLFSVLNLRGNAPPPTWHLLKEIERPLAPWRLEPLRVWQIGT